MAQNYDPNALTDYKKVITDCEQRLQNDLPIGYKLEKLYCRLVCACLEVEEYNKAMTYCQKMLEIPQIKKDKKNQAFAYEKLGNVYQSFRNYTEAEKKYKAALENLHDDEGKSRINSILGKLYEDLGRFDQAFQCYEAVGSFYQSLEQYQEAIKWFEQCLGISGKKTDEQMQSLAKRRLGDIFTEIKYYPQALECYKEVLEILERFPEENKKEIGQTCQKMAYIYHQLYHRPGRMQFSAERAKEFYERAIQIAHETDQKETELKLLQELGYLCRTIKEFDHAKKYYEDAHKIACHHDIKDKDLSSYLKTIGDCGKCLVGLIKLKLKHKEEERNRKTEINPHDDKVLKEMFQTAQNKFSDQLERSKKCKKLAFETDSLVNLINLAFLKQDKKLAIYYLTEFEKLAKLKDDPSKRIATRELIDPKKELDNACKELLSSVRYEKSRVNVMQTQFKEAKRKFDKLLELWDKKFEHVFFPHHENSRCQSSFEIGFQDSQEMTRIYVEHGSPKDALLACQNGREHQLTVDLIKYKYPQGNTDNLLDVMKDAHFGAVVYYLDNPDGVNMIWSLWPNVEEPSLHMVRNVQGAPTCKDVVDSFYKALEAPDVDRTLPLLQEPHATRPLPAKHTSDAQSFQNSNDINEILDKLSKKLVAPIGNEVIDMEEIVIDQDASLHNVPFAALRDSSGQFLSETKRIRVMPSLATLKILMECPDNYHSNDGALVIGGPEVGQVMLNGKPFLFEKLKHAVREGQTVGKILTCNPLLSKNATKKQILEMVSAKQKHAIIHFAAHGKNGKIALAPSPPTVPGVLPSEKDYMLTINEVKGLGIKAKLVVLSCCKSGRGDITAAGEVQSLCRAFLAAGARSVLASLWSIDDKKTGILMKHFYTNLKKGEKIGVSLQKAMKEVKGKYPHPKHWASFVHVAADDFAIFPKPTDTASTCENKLPWIKSF